MRVRRILTHALAIAVGAGLIFACCPRTTIAPVRVAKRIAPINAQPYDPPQTYLRWWVQVAACAGIVPGTDTRTYPEIQWFVVDELRPLFDYEPMPGHNFTGLHHKGAIYILKGYRMVRRTIQHEMLHALGVKHDYVWLWDCTEREAYGR